MKSLIVFVSILIFANPINAEILYNKNGTVSDTITGLMWEPLNDDLYNSSPEDAYSHILSLISSSQYNDWRLPTIDEIRGFLSKRSSDLLLINRVYLTRDVDKSSGRNLCYVFILSAYPEPDIGIYQCLRGQVFAVRYERMPYEEIYSSDQIREAVSSERNFWDADADGKIGLPEAIRALQTISGMRQN